MLCKRTTVASLVGAAALFGFLYLADSGPDAQKYLSPARDMVGFLPFREITAHAERQAEYDPQYWYGYGYGTGHGYGYGYYHTGYGYGYGYGYYYGSHGYQYGYAYGRGHGWNYGYSGGGRYGNISDGWNDLLDNATCRWVGADGKEVRELPAYKVQGCDRGGYVCTGSVSCISQFRAASGKETKIPFTVANVMCMTFDSATCLSPKECLGTGGLLEYLPWSEALSGDVQAPKKGT